MQSLPAVARRVHTFCKKCDADRYHIVLAHTTSTSAKVECEVCHLKKTYKIDEPRDPVKRTVTRSSGTISSARSPRNAQAAHEEAFQKLLVDFAAKPEVAYNMREKHRAEEWIKHPKFGRGFVRTATGDRIEVMFADEIKTLLHNKN